MRIEEVLKNEMSLYIYKNQGVDDIPALIRILTPLIAGLTFQIGQSSRNSTSSRFVTTFAEAGPTVEIWGYANHGELSGVRDGTLFILDARRRRKSLTGHQGSNHDKLSNPSEPYP